MTDDVCLNCGREDPTVRVWDDLTDFADNEEPDYVGCYECREMEEL